MKAIFFDLDDTLYSYQKANAIAFPAVCAFAQSQLGIPAETFAKEAEAELAAMKQEIGKQAAIHNRMIRFLRILERHGKPLHYAPILNDLYWNTLIAASIPEPGIEDCLRQLKAQGYVLGIASNMTLDWQIKKLQALGLLAYFSHIVSSEEAGADKPESAIFKLCSRKVGFAPQKCVMVGDSYKNDVLGAEQVGMRAILYAPQEEASKSFQISHFSQLQKVISML